MNKQTKITKKITPESNVDSKDKLISELQERISYLENNNKDLTKKLNLLYPSVTQNEITNSLHDFVAIADVVISIIYIVSDQKFSYVNPAFIKFTGYSQEEVFEMNFWHFVYLDDRDMVKENGLRRLKGEPVPNDYEFRIITKQNEVKWVQINNSLIRYKDKNSIIGIAFDVTEKKHFEFSLKENEKKYKISEQMAKLGCWELDIINNKLTWSDEIFRIFELDASKFIPTYEAFLTFVHPDDRNFVNNAYIDSIKNKSSYDICHRLLLLDGTIKFVQEKCYSDYDSLGNPVKSFGMVLDQTEQDRARQDLIESNEKFSAITQSAKDAIIMIENSGKVVFWNKAAFTIFGWSAEEITGKNLHKLLVSPTDFKMFSERFPEFIDSGKGRAMEQTLELKAIKKDGSSIFIDLSLSSLLIKNQRHAIGIVRDITEKKIQEDFLNKQNIFLSSIIESLSHPFYVINAHDFSIEIANKAFLDTYNLKEISKGKHFCYEVTHKQKTPCATKEHPCPVQAVIETKKPSHAEHIHYNKHGFPVYFELHAFPIFDDKGKVIKVIEYSLDITSRKNYEEDLKLNEKRFESLLSLYQLHDVTPQDILDVTLEEAVKLTQSKIGYIYFYDENSKLFTLNSWSKDVLPACAVMEKQIVYELDKIGFWGEAVRQKKPVINNDFKLHNSLKNGTPEGHVEISKFLTIPVFYYDKIVAVIGVGNKGDNYNDGDIRQLSLLMDSVWSIIERKKAEDALVLHEQRYRVIVESLNEGIFSTEKGLFIFVNNAMATIFGYTPDEMLGMSSWELAIEEEQISIRNKMTQLAHNRDVTPVEVLCKRKDGEQVLVEISINFSYTDFKVIGVVRDITGIRRAEKEITEKNRFNELLLNALPHVAYLIGRDRKILAFNKQAKELGAMVDEFCWCGIYHQDNISEDEKEFYLNYKQPRTGTRCSFCLADEMFKTGKTLNKEVDVHGKTWDTFWVPINENTYLHFAIDITERKQLSEKLEKMIMEMEGTNWELKMMNDELRFEISERLKVEGELKLQKEMLNILNERLEKQVEEEVQKNREKDHLMISQSRQAAMGEMIGNIAHQWRQPLNNIGLMIYDLLDLYRNNELTLEQFEKREAEFRSVIKQMSHTIDDFRYFFKPDKEKHNFSLLEVIEKSKTFVNAGFCNNSIVLSIEMNEDYIINGLPNEFAQVLLNILNNAKDAIAVSKPINPKVNITVSGNEEHRVYIIICDNGGGIPESLLYKIFDPYFTTKSEMDGTGIGLYMSKTIIEKNMGGKLTVSNKNGGAEFVIDVSYEQIMKKE